MAAHARLNNEFTEDEKYHNLNESWAGLIYVFGKVCCSLCGINNYNLQLISIQYVDLW